MKASHVNRWRGALLCAFVFSTMTPAPAQDTRHVVEPKVPAVCTVVQSQLAALDGKTVAEADETKLDTKRIQEALDRCQAGQAVKLAADGSKNAFLSGPLQLRRGVTLLVDAGAILFASRNPRLYDVSAGSCGIVDNKGGGCKPLIAGDRVPDAGVMGEGVIDGRGGTSLIGRKESWWDLAQEAKIKNADQNCPRLLVMTGSDNFTLYRITLKNSPNFHVVFSRGNGFTAWGVIINTPKTARNADGIDTMNATNVTITRSFIFTGDDNVAIKAGSAGPSSHITVIHNHFYAGHGMSIGSETDGGVSAIRVSDLSIDGADNGLRIKSNATRGGLVRDVVYEDICIRETTNPVLMDTHYTATISDDRGKIPIYQDIVLKNVRIFGSGKITLDGYGGDHPLGLVFDNVFLDAPKAVEVAARHARIEGSLQAGIPNKCENKFVPMPAKSLP